MKGRQGAVALMAAAAMAAPASASPQGAARSVSQGLPRFVPGPRGAQIVYDTPEAFSAALGGRAVGQTGGYAGLSDSTIHFKQGTRPSRFEIAHEMGHLLDSQVLTDSDRQRFSRMLRAPSGDWWADTDSPMGSASEWFADYYATAALRRPPRRRGGMLVQATSQAYAEVGPRRLRRFVAAMDEIRRTRGLQQFKLP